MKVGTHDGISGLIRRELWFSPSPTSSPLGGHGKNVASCKPESVSSTDTLDLQASKNVKNKFLLFKPPRVVFCHGSYANTESKLLFPCFRLFFFEELPKWNPSGLEPHPLLLKKLPDWGKKSIAPPNLIIIY